MSTDQTKGEFVAYFNKDKATGDKLPVFEKGKLQIPGTEDVRLVTLWGYEYADAATGEVKTRYSGTAKPAPDGDPKARVAGLVGEARPDDVIEHKGLTLKAHGLVLFPNKFQEEAPEAGRPDLHGYYYPGDGAAVVDVGAWVKTTRYGDPIMSGKTGYHVPGKSVVALQDDFVAEQAAPTAKKPGRGRATGGRDE